jgi:hypothetical protein
MKLSAIRIQRTLSQLEEQTAFPDPRVIPDNNPAVPQLNELFGEHTFFLDGDGLHIVEPADPPSSVPTGKVVSLAAWKDGKRTALSPHRPQATGVLVILGADEATDDEIAEEAERALEEDDSDADDKEAS